MAVEQGQRIRETRQAMGATLDHLAEVTGLTKQYLSRIELGQVASNDSEILAMIARAMRVAPAWLAYGAPPLPEGR